MTNVNVEELAGIATLQKVHGYWGEHPEVPHSDWVEEVRNNETRTSYWEYVYHRLEER